MNYNYYVCKSTKHVDDLKPLASLPFVEGIQPTSGSGLQPTQVLVITRGAREVREAQGAELNRYGVTVLYAS